MQNQQRVILITGASKGIGRACVRKFLTEGFKVGLIGRNEDSLIETANHSPDTLILQCDVSNPNNVKASFEKLKEKWGRLDVLFNNAGIGTPSELPDEMTYEQWKEVIDINLNGSFLCVPLNNK